MYFKVKPMPRHSARSHPNAVCGVLALSLSLASVLSGCGTGTEAPVAAATGLALRGGVHGGNQPVSGAKIYLFAANTTGTTYAGAATSLLNSPGYVTTSTTGSWSITGDYTCPAGAYVYLLAVGGNPGLASGTNNADLALMSGLGSCSSLNASEFFNINEVTTVATAYALAQFMTGETNVGSSSSNSLGLGNAFAVIPNLVNTTTGVAPAVTAAGNGTVPQATINSLANALVPCVNSDGSGTACSSLMSAANVTGSPMDTVQAAINIAHNPGVNVAAIYNQSTPSAAFQPVLSAAPNDWTVQLQYSGGLNQVQGLAFDASGNLYATNSNGANMVEFSPIGTVLNTLTAPTMYRPQEIGIDLNGNIWTEGRANATYGYAASLIEFSPNGTLLSGSLGFTGGGLNMPRGLAVDPRGNIWAAGSSEVSEFTSAGVPVSGSSGYTYGGFLAVQFEISFDTLGNAWVVSESSDGTSNALTKFTPVSAASNAAGIYGGSPTSVGSGTLTYPLGVAIDASNDVWVANSNNLGSGGAGVASITEYTNSGAELSPTAGYTNGGLSNPQTVVIDGLGNIFTSQDQVAEYTKAGVAITGATGYQTVNGNDCCLAAAIDSAGNFWTSGLKYVYQWVGLAAPVVTPKVKGVVNGTLGARP